jgi:hypothetical protein
VLSGVDARVYDVSALAGKNIYNPQRIIIKLLFNYYISKSEAAAFLSSVPLIASPSINPST